MAPSVTVDIKSDFNITKSPSFKQYSSPRTLLLSPPSLSSHPEKLNQITEAHDRSHTDIQMLDRLSLSLVSLPDSTYDLILILLDFDETQKESRKLLSRDVLSRIVAALKPGGRLKSQDGKFASSDSLERKEAILAGLVVDQDGMVKPSYESTQTVPLRLGKKSEGVAGSVAHSNGTEAVPLNVNGKRGQEVPSTTQPAGVGFVDFSDDFGEPAEESDDELIDENTLLDASDFSRPVVPPPSCRPPTGKRRRACKDCTCGLAQRLEAEDAAKRSAADQNLAKLNASDLAEVDFTVKGKVGSCGNCALGDAFRCDGCPYIGLPAFKNGEVVRLQEEEVQL